MWEKMMMSADLVRRVPVTDRYTRSFYSALRAGLVLLLASCAGSDSSPTGTGPDNSVAPIAAFTASVRAGEPGVSVQFNDTSTPGSAAITGWAWNFGDGASSNVRNPSHTYASPGFNTVTLTVTTSVGSDLETKSDFIEIYQRVIVSVASATADRPAIPTITQYNQSLANQSGTLYLDQGFLNEFRPLLDSLQLTYWTNTRSENDCPSNLGAPVPVGATTAWRTSLPIRSGGTPKYFLAYTPADAYPGTFPQRITLWANNGTAGGVPRWQGCEEMKPFLQDYYSANNISMNQQIAQRPIVRHYRIWKKVGEVPLGTAGIYSQSRTLGYGVENSTAYEFSASITGTVGTGPLTPGMAASLSVTLSASFSTAQTISSTNTTTDTYTAPPNLPNYNQVFSLWQLVDVYQVEGTTPGVLWSDANHAVRSPQTQFRIESPTSLIAPMSIWIRVP
jgi:PKD repeat protein